MNLSRCFGDETSTNDGTQFFVCLSVEGGKWGLADSVRMTSFGAWVTGPASLSSYHLTTISEQPICHCASRIKSNVALSIKEVLKNKAAHTMLPYEMVKYHATNFIEKKKDESI